MLPTLTPEQSKYTSDVLQKLIDIPMVRRVKIDPKYCMYGFSNQYNVIDLDVVTITPPDTSHPNWPKTVQAIRYIIDAGLDKLNGFNLDLNSSFTKFRKYKLIPKTK